MNDQLLNTVSATIIRRINFPRALTRAQNKTSANNAKLRALLTQEEEAEIRQTCALVLIQADAENFPLPYSAWIACFRASRIAITSCASRITKRFHDEISQNERLDIQSADFSAYGPRDTNAEFERRARIAKRANYLRSVMHAAFTVDPSRKKQVNRTRALRFVRFATRALAGFGHGIHEEVFLKKDTRKKTRQKIQDYLMAGEMELTRQTLNGAPTRKTRDCKSFSELAVLMNGISA